MPLEARPVWKRGSARCPFAAEAERRAAGLPGEELSEGRLVGEAERIGNLLDVQVRAAQQPPGVGAEQFRQMGLDRVARHLLHNPREVGGRDVEPSGVEGDVVGRAVVLDGQTLEAAEISLGRLTNAGALARWR